MKKLTIILMAITLLLGMSSLASAGCMVSATWTPSPNADSEKLLVDGDEQTCTEAGKCDFIVPSLTGQEVVIRSFNSQGGYIDYAAKTLDEDNLPDPASGITITIMCTN